MEKNELTFHYQKSFALESGGTLQGFQLRYATLGKLNADRSNVVWVCHALTGSADFTDWWSGLFNEGRFFDPRHYFIICANVLGGCYGSTGHLSLNPQTGKPFYHSFPTLTNRDVVRALDTLRQDLGLEQVHTLIGGSLGGQQVLEWAVQQPDVFQHIIPIATNAVHSPWGIAFNEAQRMAIEADATWKENDHRAGIDGLKAARAIGMISYRYYDTYGQTQAEKSDDTLEDFRSSTYQRYQGQKLANRFNAFTYYSLSRMMDSHNVGRQRGGVVEALKSIKARTLIVGIDSDILFPLSEQKFLADHIPNARLEVMSSLYGHDGFLVEFEQLSDHIKQFFREDLVPVEVKLK
ncbi:homoserine O-acetyltransferase family protein [Chryseolinea lacunae]|uniref:Homoserine O-acetyltransferase n=1 Tax=Chryseolinea lacunae TaxID=2801331 RepID=A0ABS1KSI6_9BACT|nr:homoserine O-acetyltransferase [Chryseolinea lacunae]MBL0742424.1 homoserine O-acetyltransferase [Chryseolinea lacunae]